METEFGWWNELTDQLDLWGDAANVFFDAVLHRRLWETADTRGKRLVAFFEDPALRDQLHAALAAIGVEAHDDTADIDADIRSVWIGCNCSCPDNDATPATCPVGHDITIDYGDTSVSMPLPGGKYTKEQIAYLVKAAIVDRFEVQDLSQIVSSMEQELGAGATAAARLGYRVEFAFAQTAAVTVADTVITVAHTGVWGLDEWLVAELNTRVVQLRDRSR